MTVVHYYLCHPYYHAAWYFDLIQIMPHHLHPQSHQKHCCVKNLYKIIRTWYYESSVWVWIGIFPLVIIVDMAYYFAHGNFYW